MPISDAPATPLQRPLPLLEFQDVNTHYGELHVLKGVNYRVGVGEVVCLLGGNASGKSTTMKTIFGIVKPKTGSVLYGSQKINDMPTADRVKRGIAPVPEARRLFPRMTVLENLEMGAFTRADVSGVWRTRAPVASKMALAMAADVARLEGSPAPFGGSSG